MGNEIEERLVNLILNNEEFSFLNDTLKMDADIASLGINSLTYIKLIVAIEKEYGIEFDDEELDIENLNTLGDLVSSVENLLNKRKLE